MELPFFPQPKKTKHIRVKPKLTERTTFSPSVRKQIKSRDNGVCRECDRARGTSIHHVKPKGRDGRGKGVYTNGLLVCNPCHTKIHDDPGLMKRWQNRFEQMYGDKYWHDEWDKS